MLYLPQFTSEINVLDSQCGRWRNWIAEAYASSHSVLESKLELEPRFSDCHFFFYLDFDILVVHKKEIIQNKIKQRTEENFISSSYRQDTMILRV